ncbi:MAG: glycosyltransferase family 2 protein [Chloroflexia bacterium]
MGEINPKSKIQSSKSPSVAIVIPTHNNLSLLLECLESVRALDYPREQLEIIVVDNASTDRTQAVLSERYPHIKLVTLETNTGFAPACNRGAAEADAEYVAFLNNDAVADPNWLHALLAALEVGGEGTVCAASTILSRDGDEVEFEGAASNLFGAGKPQSVWGWPDLPAPPTTGTPLLFASGGAMLIRRDTFLAVGGFDPAYFAYFEDVDLGWRLWVLGYRVVYAPEAIVRHIGGATGKRVGLHRRYTLWESNALATVLKNYEGGNMERVLSAALLLEYRRALLSAGDAFEPGDYQLSAPPDTRHANIERLPKISVAHLAGVARLNSLLPHFMSERKRIQSQRKRSDAEILPLLGRAFEPQFAGTAYAKAARALYSALDLYGLTAPSAPSRVLLVGSQDELSTLASLARRLKDRLLISIAIVGDQQPKSSSETDGYTLHTLTAGDRALDTLISRADAIIATPIAISLPAVIASTAPLATWGATDTLQRATKVTSPDDPTLLQFGH